MTYNASGSVHEIKIAIALYKALSAAQETKCSVVLPPGFKKYFDD
jgi:hypothetical protein